MTVRPLAEHVATVLEDPSDAAGIDPAVVGESDASLEQIEGVVRAFRRSLDRCGSSAPGEEVAKARSYLERTAVQLWSLASEAEVRTIRDFLVEVAHDFRSPLHSSLFLTKSLFQEENGPLTRSQRRRLSVVHSALEALLRLTNDLLDFSEHEEELTANGVMEIPFSMERVVGDLEDLLEPVVHHRRANLSLTLEGPKARRGDPHLLNRVLLNLVSNAIEAVSEGGTVRMKIAGDERELVAEISNDSDDVDPDRLQALIRGGDYSSVVRRLDGQTRGLGLVISGRLIRAADGGLTVQKTDDGWTRITVRIPFPVLAVEA